MPHFPPGLLVVLVKDALRSSSLDVARTIVRHLFELCNADAGDVPDVDMSQLSVSSGDLLRTLVQLYAVSGTADETAHEQLERAIGQPCTWTHLHKGSDELEQAGADTLHVVRSGHF